MTTVVLCPMEIERAAMARAVGARARALRTGWGPDVIAEAVHKLADREDRPTLVILAGVAGGLRDGPVARVAGTVVDQNGGRWTPTIGAERLGATGATILGVDRPVSEPERKRALAERFDADLVDCESHALARACEKVGLAWAVVRGVSDGPDDLFPEQVARWIGPDGSLRPGCVAIDVMRRPALAIAAVQLHRRSKRALRGVGALASALLDASADSIAER